MKWDDVRIGDKVRGHRRGSSYGVIVVDYLDAESLVAEAATGVAGGVICTLSEPDRDGVAEGYFFLDSLDLVERAPGPALTLDQLRAEAAEFRASKGLR